MKALKSLFESKEAKARREQREQQYQSWHARWQETKRQWVVDNSTAPHEHSTLSGYSDRANALTVLPDGRLASGSWEEINLWDVVSGRCESTLSGHSGFAVKALTVLPDGRLASGSIDKSIKLWDVGLRPARGERWVQKEGKQRRIWPQKNPLLRAKKQLSGMLIIFLIMMPQQEKQLQMHFGI